MTAALRASRSRAHEEIAAAWHGIAGEGHDDVLADVLRRHAEAHRHYHTAEHVMSVVRHLDALITDMTDTDMTDTDMTDTDMTVADMTVAESSTSTPPREQQARRNMQRELDTLVSAAQAPGSPAP